MPNLAITKSCLVTPLMFSAEILTLMSPSLASSSSMSIANLAISSLPAKGFGVVLPVKLPTNSIVKISFLLLRLAAVMGLIIAPLERTQLPLAGVPRPLKSHAPSTTGLLLKSHVTPAGNSSLIFPSFPIVPAVSNTPALNSAILIVSMAPPPAPKLFTEDTAA